MMHDVWVFAQHARRRPVAGDNEQFAKTQPAGAGDTPITTDRIKSDHFTRTT